MKYLSPVLSDREKLKGTLQDQSFTNMYMDASVF